MAIYGRLIGAVAAGFWCVSATHASCALVGDSIAHGAAAYAPHCLRATWPGLTSRRWTERFGGAPIQADAVVISMGTNERGDPALQGLWMMRSRIQSPRVMWIAPGPQYPSRASVFNVAAQYGDLVFERPLEDLARDGIHFTQNGSRRIAMLVGEPE